MESGENFLRDFSGVFIVPKMKFKGRIEIVWSLGLKKVKVKVKQSHYKPGQAQRVSEV